MQGEDAFFDGVGGHQPVNGHRALLAHAVGAVAGLVFYCRVPPGVQMQHIVGGGQRQARAAGFQADEKHLALTALKRFDFFLALARRGGAVQVVVGNALFVQPAARQRQVIDKLAKHQRLVAVVQQLAHQPGKGGQLAAGQGGVGQGQGGVAAQPAQAGDVRQHLHGALVLGRLRHLLQRLLAQGFVQLAFAVGQLDPIGQLGARRQFGQHLGLGAAQDKGLQQAAQRQAGWLVALGNWRGKALAKLLQAAQQTRIEKTKQAPQLAQMVFYWGAAGGQPKIGAQGKRRLGAAGVRVFDGLGFVQNHAGPMHLGKAFGVQLKQAIADHHQIPRRQRVQRALLGIRPQAQAGGKAGGFGQPVLRHRGGGDHQLRAVFGAQQAQRQGLHGFAQAHIVGQTSAHAPVRQPRQPMKTGQLIIAQRGAQGAGHGGADLLQRLPARALRGPAGVAFTSGGAVGQLRQHRRGQPAELGGAVGVQPGAGAGQRGQLLTQRVVQRQPVGFAQAHIAAAVLADQG